MKLEVKTKNGSYPVIIERGALKKASQVIGTGSRVFIVTDSGVPKEWVGALKDQFRGAKVFVIPQGEASKNIRTWTSVMSAMLSEGISRKDTVAALGGGVTGDIGGFAAACYMRGIRFVNIPTTVLAQADSSIGGKTGLDMDGIKNCVGAFWQPSAVISDPDVLSTLPERQFASGMAEAVKAGVIGDPALFEIFESGEAKTRTEEIIRRAVLVKKRIVEEDELESGKRMLLNFGHTIGHAVEALSALDAEESGGSGLLHGECVAIGMVLMTVQPELKARLKKVLEGLGLPTGFHMDKDKALSIIEKDKKANRGMITTVQADEIGKAYLKELSIEELGGRLAQ